MHVQIGATPHITFRNTTTTRFLCNISFAGAPAPLYGGDDDHTALLHPNFTCTQPPMHPPITPPLSTVTCRALCTAIRMQSCKGSEDNSEKFTTVLKELFDRRHFPSTIISRLLLRMRTPRVLSLNVCACMVSR